MLRASRLKAPSAQPTDASQPLRSRASRAAPTPHSRSPSKPRGRSALTPVGTNTYIDSLSRSSQSQSASKNLLTHTSPLRRDCLLPRGKYHSRAFPSSQIPRDCIPLHHCTWSIDAPTQRITPSRIHPLQRTQVMHSFCRADQASI